MGRRGDIQRRAHLAIVPAAAGLALALLITTPLNLAIAQGAEAGLPTDEEGQAYLKELESSRLRPTQQPGLSGPQGPGEPVTEPPSCGFYDKLVCAILDATDHVLSGLFIGVAKWTAGGFFDMMVNVNRAVGQPTNELNITGIAVSVGYPVILGVANIFFVLILLWIAIATIFDFEPYTARSLLPRLIIAALLINFSLAIGSAFINLSNGIADIFYTNLTRTKNISEVIRIMYPTEKLLAEATRPLKGVDEKTRAIVEDQLRKTSKAATPQVQASTGLATINAYECEKSSAVRSLRIGNPAVEIFCRNLVLSVYNALNATPPNAQVGPVLVRAQAIAWKIVIFPIFIFVLFAAGILLLIRVIALAFVLIFGPVAFLSLALPAMQRFHGMWWSSLTQWSFFFPAFMFLFWLTFAMYSRIPTALLTSEIAGQSQRIDLYGGLFAYFIASAFLIGSLIVANKFGIYGASTVTGWGKKLAGATGKWAKGTGKIFAGMAAGATLGTAVGKRIGSTPYLRGLNRPFEAIAAAGQKVREDREKAALKRRTVAAKVSPRYGAELMRGMRPSEQADLIEKLNDKQVKDVMRTMDERQQVDLYKRLRESGAKDKVLERVLGAMKDFTTAMEAETGVGREAGGFAEAVKAWLQNATRAQLQKRISATDIRENFTFEWLVQNAIELDKLKTIIHSPEKANALGDLFMKVGGTSAVVEDLMREQKLSREAAIEQAGVINRGLEQIRKSNPRLSEQVAGSPATQAAIKFGIAFGRKVKEPPPEKEEGEEEEEKEGKPAG